MWFALSLSLLLVVYNNVINRWRPFHGVAYVPLNLTFAGLIILIAASTLKLSRSELGFQGDITDAAISLAAVVTFGIGALVLARSRHAHRVADRRVAGLGGGALALHVLVRIPIGTAFAEEVLFRGVLFATWRDAGLSITEAALYASLAFGLWHITPTIIGIRINDPGATRRWLRIAVLGAVALTTIAGLGLTWLRIESSGLIAPIMLHGGINSVSALAAVRAGGNRAHP
jgi:membrane protease YdiL (CAAX protease family)